MKKSSSPTTFDAGVLKSFSEAITSLKKQGTLTPKMTMEELAGGLNAKQKQVVQEIVRLDPKDYGVSTPYIGLESVPTDLIVVSGQQYIGHGDIKTIDDKYVPRHIYDAFVRMNDAFKLEHPGRLLLILAGYRSPAYQVVVFINWLTNNYGGDIAATIRQASPPAYSQHCIASKTALDFKNIDGLPSDETPEDFKTTIEYEWLRKNAKAFNFNESWPEGNQFDMRPEPWHWQYIGKVA